MSITRDELSKALVDVRNAYRLLHAYHRRLCDLLQSVDETVSKAGLRFEQWDCANVAALASTKPFFVPYNYAWDLTPGYQIRPQWTDQPKKKANRKDSERRVVIEAHADTGYDDSMGGEPDPTKFKPTDQVTTELRINLSTAGTSTPDWDAVTKKILAPPGMYDGQLHTINVEGVDYTYQYFEVDVAELVDDAAVKAKLLAPIEAWLSATERLRP
jgi:hypothetical protein